MKKHNILLIDNSWSMNKYEKKIRKGLSKLITSLKNTNSDEIYLSVVFFSDIITYRLKAQKVDELTTNYFDNPMFEYGGSTSLYDSINQILIEWCNQTLDENVLYIVSDGDDNSSKTSKNDSNMLVTEFEKTGKWKIVYCNTDISTMNVSHNITFKIDEIDDLLEQLNTLKI